MSTIDFTRNRQLALAAKMSVSDPRMSTFMHNWLLHYAIDQATADETAAMVEACARLLGYSRVHVGDWDALVHCVAVSVYMDGSPDNGGCYLDFVYKESGWYTQQELDAYERAWVTGDEIFGDRMASIFGTRFVGNPYIANFIETHAVGQATQKLGVSKF